MRSCHKALTLFFAATALGSILIAQDPEPGTDAAGQFLDRLERIRREEQPTLQEVRDRSDAVAIVTMISEDLAPEGVKPEGIDETSDEAIVTKVAVVASLAGDVKGDSIEILHVRYRQPNNVINLSHRVLAKFRREIEWPDMIAIDFGDDRLKYSAGDKPHVVQPKYLVFLKRRADGRYELATGKFRDGSASVRLFDGREAH